MSGYVKHNDVCGCFQGCIVLVFSTSEGYLTSMLRYVHSRSPRDTTFPTMVLRFQPLNFQMNEWQSLVLDTISTGQILTVMMPVPWQKNLLLVFLILHSPEKDVIGSMRAGYSIRHGMFVRTRGLFSRFADFCTKRVSS